MNHELKAPQDIEPILSSCKTGVGKPRIFTGALLALTGAALCMGVTSCVSPYDTHGGGYVTTQTYSPGYRVNSLPGGYRRETISGSTYYYHDGYYYRQGSGGYVVVEAPRSSRYYSDYNQYQQRHQTHRQRSVRRDSRYDDRQVISRLPRGYREINHRGTTYYQSGDRYYSRQGSGYVVVSRPY